MEGKILKKILSVVLAAVLALGVFAINVPAYKAEGDISVSISPSPASLPEGGGTVDFAVSVKNNTQGPITDIRAYYGDKYADIDDLAATDTGTGTIQDVSLTTAQLGTTLHIKVSYTVNGTPQEQTFSTKVEKKVPEAKLDVKCKVDRTAAPKDGKVNFTIILENTGEAKLTNIAVYLKGINGDKKIPVKTTTMNPDKQMTVTYAHTMKEDVEVTPIVKYKANGEDGEIKKDVKKLVIADYGLDLEIAADNENPASADDKVNFTLTVKNSGNAELHNIKVYDHLQNEVKLSNTTLLPGAKTTKKMSYTFDQTTKVEFTATADDKDDLTHDFKSNDVSISMPIDKSKVKLEIKADADVKELTEPGTVKFKVTVVNSGAYPLQDVVVTEDQLGEIGKDDTLEVGDKYYEKQADISAAGTYTFKVTAKDADGNPYSAEAAPIEIKMAAPAETSGAPAISGATDVPVETTGAPKGDSLGSIVVIMIIVIVLIIAVVVALVVLVNKEKRSLSRQKPGAGKSSIKYRNKNNF
jgi:uncharacterized repeat protein (TIGR01451 family)